MRRTIQANEILKEKSENMITQSRLVINMEVKDGGVKTKVRLGGNEKTYFFPFSIASDQSNRISMLIGSLPLKFYIDAFLEDIKT